MTDTSQSPELHDGLPVRTSELPVEVIRSARRKKTVQARVVDGRLQVLIPATLSEADEAKFVAQMRERVERKTSSHHIDLSARADRLAATHGLARPHTITWSDRQQWRWGSCTPTRGTIRISRRLAQMPDWVLDYVIVHELAHLEVAGHGPAFQALVNRYPRAERAKGYLIAKAEES